MQQPQPMVSWGHKTHSFWPHEHRRYSSSSSYSSSDESEESEAPLQRLLRQSASAHHMPHTMTTSTDALSLDGILDSVSSGGSFSSPPNTPKKLQQHHQDCELYENNHLSCDSLERYNGALETLRLTHDGAKQAFSSTPDTINQAPLIPGRPARGDPVAEEVERRQRREDLEKQRKLSDWYYIKTSPKPRQPQLSPRRGDLELRKKKLPRGRIDGGSQRLRQQPPPLPRIPHQASDSAIVSDVQRNSCGTPHFPVQYQSERVERSPMVARRWHQARFGEMSSSSFEHVNLGSYPTQAKRLSSVHNLYENTTPRESLRPRDKFIIGPSRPLPRLPMSSLTSEQVSNVCFTTKTRDTIPKISDKHAPKEVPFGTISAPQPPIHNFPTCTESSRRIGVCFRRRSCLARQCRVAPHWILTLKVEHSGDGLKDQLHKLFTHNC
uniref:Uncharacterized protein n=1 Tax=Lutzomyia longipalpis TaxID=7200 RepID=A0A1B0EVC3_LUTLO